MNTIRVYAVSLGCPKNQVDTERMLGSFGAALSLVPEPKDADVVLINTCGFIESAVSESLQSILDISEMVTNCKPKPLLVVTGCLVARYGQTLLQELPEVDLFLEISKQSELVERVMQALGRDGRHVAGRLLSSAPSFAYLKIAEGCDNACRFCTIPSIRGPLTSFTQESILEDARFCLEQGRKELVVVAQDVTAYGRDRKDAKALRELLSNLAGLPGLQWLRLMYMYPAGLSRDFLSFLRDLGAPFVPYFDVPLQHAHPDILAAMGRPFQRDPREVVELIREFFPQAALRTSLIVGYPGETEKEFRALEDFVREARFQHLGVFPFWREDGTSAALLPHQLEDNVKEERRERIMALQAEISEDLLTAFSGQEVDVLVDKPHEEWPGLFEGRVWFQAPEVDGITYISGEGVKPGAMVHALVEESKTYDLVALA